MLLQTFNLYVTFCAIGLINARLFQQTILQSKRLEVCPRYATIMLISTSNSLLQTYSQGLLGLARGIFEDTTNLSVMIRKIMLEAQELIPCKTCRVLLVDDSPPGVSFSGLVSSCVGLRK